MKSREFRLRLSLVRKSQNDGTPTSELDTAVTWLLDWVSYDTWSRERSIFDAWQMWTAGYAEQAAF